MNRVITRIAAALMAAALLASAGSAHAEKAAIDDPFRDLWQTTAYGEEDAVWNDIGTRVNVDIDRSVIRHSVENLVATITFKALKKRGDRFVNGWKVRTDADREFLVGVDAESGRWAGSLTLFDLNPPPESELDGPGLLECEGAGHEVDYVADKVKVWVPRSCLGDPEWIKGMSFAESHTSDRSIWVRDHGLHRGHELRGWTERLSVD